MPELDLDIGGRSYRVACDPGEEDALKDAAGLLAAEATALITGGGANLPESRFMLLAALMLADKTRQQGVALAQAQDRARALELRAERAEAEAARAQPAAPAQEAQPALFEDEERTARELLAQIALELEALAEDLEGDA